MIRHLTDNCIVHTKYIYLLKIHIVPFLYEFHDILIILPIIIYFNWISLHKNKKNNAKSYRFRYNMCVQKPLCVFPICSASICILYLLPLFIILKTKEKLKGNKCSQSSGKFRFLFSVRELCPVQGCWNTMHMCVRFGNLNYSINDSLRLTGANI